MQFLTHDLVQFDLVLKITLAINSLLPFSSFSMNALRLSLEPNYPNWKFALPIVLELSTPKLMFYWEVSLIFHCSYYFDACSKNSINFFSRTPMNTLWMDENKIIKKWKIAAKWYWCQINEHKSCTGQKCFNFMTARTK